jgi:carbon-monoxide dehydrogenase large subunit
MERLVDTAAAEMNIDPIALRRRNLIRGNQMPYRNALGITYDSGDFPSVLDAALKLADVDGFASRKKDSKRLGRYRGIGVGFFVEISGPGSGELGGIHFQPDGSVTINSGTHDHGQGHGSPFAQVLVDRLSIPFDKLHLRQSDSDEIQKGGSTGGSRSAVSATSALIEACNKVLERGRRLAAYFLEASDADVDFVDGLFTIAGTDRSIGLLEIAARVHSGVVLPPDLPKSLDVHEVASGNYPSTYPNGCHVAEVEIDPETGETRLVKYTSVDDFGTLLNPMIVEGQVHGGVMMGVGQALMERAAFDDSGQLLTGSFLDYAMPRAEDAPFFTCGNHPVPTKTNPLGLKGCGEAGVSGALAAVMNAVSSALRPLGVRPIDMPATSSRVWEAIHLSTTA